MAQRHNCGTSHFEVFMGPSCPANCAPHSVPDLSMDSNLRQGVRGLHSDAAAALWDLPPALPERLRQCLEATLELVGIRDAQKLAQHDASMTADLILLLDKVDATFESVDSVHAAWARQHLRPLLQYKASSTDLRLWVLVAIKGIVAFMCDFGFFDQSRQARPATNSNENLDGAQLDLIVLVTQRPFQDVFDILPPWRRLLRRRRKTTCPRSQSEDAKIRLLGILEGSLQQPLRRICGLRGGAKLVAEARYQ
mmetsp:Transcript_93419/g.269797  ORF Transcript_93419/g.269797 Transcript_93419/m.269797 type:complete len:252 (+) Transcript_93419:308-1063(+)